MNSQDIIQLTQRHVMATYARAPVAFVKGKGCWLWDAEGKKYLDFVSGIAVNNLGHGHPRQLHALAEQAGKLIHTSNLFYIENQARLAQRLTERSFADRVFFCNSGGEANEAAVKLARKYAHQTFGPGRDEIICMENSFHGRTLAMLAATGKARYRQGFEPIPPGFRHVPYGAIEALRQAVTDRTCAVLVEPIQGEGGVNIPPAGYLKAVRDLCNERKLLLILDEVQTGMGRTGTLFAHEREGVVPDLMTLAKALAGGLPIGALLARDQVAVFAPGDHAATFGGNPLVTAVALAVLEAIAAEDLLENCRAQGNYLKEKLENMKSKYLVIKEIRGIGLILGIDLAVPAKPVALAALEAGLVINAVGEQTLRLLPPLIVTRQEVDQGIEILEKVLQGAK